ncbi:MAG: ABC transporter permease [Pseudonocardiaceae bacterium]|nr:ABC transporter permease [Pseudonocardiaceae bacterium]
MIKRLTALGRAEMILLRRNKVLLFNALLVPIGAALLVANLGGDGGLNAGATATVVGLFIATLLLLVVYYNLLSSYVSRRDELVLKRLRTGECRDAEILAGTALPAVTIALGQIVVLAGVGAVVLDLPAPVNPPLLVFGVLAGCVVFTALALLTAPWTRSVEAAQVTSMPIMFACLLGSGALIPLEALPDAVARVGRLLPLTPVVELTRLGWLGSADGSASLGFVGSLQEAAIPAAVALGWVVLGVLAVRRYFSWEPRR